MTSRPGSRAPLSAIPSDPPIRPVPIIVMRFLPLDLSISHELISPPVTLQLKAVSPPQVLGLAGIVGEAEQPLPLIDRAIVLVSADEFDDGDRGTQRLRNQRASFGMLAKGGQPAPPCR